MKQSEKELLYVPQAGATQLLDIRKLLEITEILDNKGKKSHLYNDTKILF